ncbi:MAG: PAS domain S-box protein, partial [Candidatus Latescibacterota bacterium]
MPESARKKHEQGLALKESRFLEYIQNAQNIIFRMDLEGRITFISRFALDSLGLTSEEAVGRGV